MRTNFQGQINSVLGSVARLTKMGAEKDDEQQEAPKAPKQKIQKAASPQAMAADRARQNAANEIDAKKKQRRNFMEYLKKEPTSIGGKVGDLSPAMQKQVASQYSKSQRRRLMDLRDKEAQNGEH